MAPPGERPAPSGATPAPAEPAAAQVGNNGAERGRPPAAADAERGNGRAPALQVDQLADLWPRIRQDVKALNRRAEALLTEADPARVVGDRITLATPYEFHREKLNSDAVRDLLQTVIGRLVGRAVTVEAVLTADLGSAIDPPVSAAPPPAPPVRLVPQPVAQEAPVVATIDDADDEARGRERLEIARNVFDGEIIDG